MVETSSPKPSSKVADNKSNSPPYKVKLVKGSKPLIHHKFYLDIEKHNVAIKIENKIKELGGSIEFILNKNITHFITDKQQSGTGSAESPATTGLKSKYHQGSQSAAGTTTSNNNSSNTFSPNVVVNPHTPRSLLDSPSVPSPVLTYDTKTGNTTTKQISRADAILLRVGQNQQQQQNTPAKPIRGIENTAGTSEQTQSPTQVVKSWGRPVWSTEHAFRFFEKVYTALKIYLPTASQEQENNKRAGILGGGGSANNQRKLSAKVKTLRGDFIKIETLDKRYRPFYQEFKKWPKINLTARLTHSPFDSEGERGAESQRSKFKKFSKIDSRTTSKFKTVGTIMTRKSRPTQQNQVGTLDGTNTTTAASRLNNSRSGSDNKQCGYCEICHVEYDVLKVHLKSEEHLKFARNDDNFASLDKLIESGANVQKFLKLNESSGNNKRDSLLNGTMKKNIKRPAQHLTNGDDSNEDCDRNGINGSSEEMSDEDAMSSPRAKRKCYNSKAKKESHPKTRHEIEHVDVRVQATRIRGLRWNAPSPESRPPVKEPPVYKIAKDSSKLSPTTNKNIKQVEHGKQVVVKLKRVRQSELNLLNNEAEQFMFPKTPTYTDSDTDDDRQTSDVNKTNNTTFDLPSSDKDMKMRSSANKLRKPQSSSRTPRTPVNKRLTKRTEILLENSDKTPEGPVGRLRFQEAPIQPHEVISKASDDRVGENHFFKSPGTTSTQSRWVNFKKKYQALENKVRFNFERVPHNEPWFVTFERQDKGYEQVYEYFGNTSYCKLPYELGPLPPFKEDCCKLDELITPNIKGSPNRKRGGKCVYPRMPSIAKVHDRTRSSTAAIIEATKVAEATNDETTNDSSKLKLTLPLKKRKLFLEEVPRKSPREHASTLAILSSMSKESSSAPSSISGANRVNKRERLPSQLSIEDDDNSNSTMTSQQTSKTVATEKDNSSVYSTSISNNQIQTNYVNIVKLCKQVDDMLEGVGDETELLEFDMDDFELVNQSSTEEDMLIGSSIGGLSEILDVCSLEELTLKSVASKEKEVQRKITYTSKPKLVTSGFRFNKKRRSNRTGWPIRRKLSLQPKAKDEELEKSGNCSTPFEGTVKNSMTPDIFAVSSDSLDTNVVNFMKKGKKQVKNANQTENNSSDEEAAEEEAEEENEQVDDDKEKPAVKSPVRSSRPNVYSRSAGRYQFEKYPKVNLTPITMTNIKTRSSDLQKRKSITPKKYTDSPLEVNRSPVSSPQKFSPKKLRKPRGRWYRER